MFNYFINNASGEPRYPTKKYSKWDAIKRLYTPELAKVKEYYRNREYNYPNSNELVRLVKILARDTDMSVLEYLAYIDTDTKYIVKQFKFVSNLNQGEVLSNVLFNGLSDELFLYVDSAVSPYDFEDTWRDYASIRVIKTDITNVHYPVLFRYDKHTPDITILEIDVKAIMLQYYYWSRERQLADRDTSVNIFIPMVVLPNISDSLIEYAVWNRFKSLYRGDEIADHDNPKHPLATIDLTKRIDKVLLDIIKDNTGTSIHITQLLDTIPGLVGSNMSRALHINKEYYNKQSKWVLWIARLSEIVSLHKMLGKRGIRLNIQLFNKLPYELKVMKRSEASLELLIDPYNLLGVNEDMEYLNKKIGKR